MKKDKGFTLIELLAVIVILAIILVIAVPQILNVIQQAKEDALISSVKMYASAIETDYLVSQASASPKGEVTVADDCPAVAKFDNGTCTYTLAVGTDGSPTATVTIVGSGKFNGLTATGTKASAAIQE